MAVVMLVLVMVLAIAQSGYSQTLCPEGFALAAGNTTCVECAPGT